MSQIVKLNPEKPAAQQAVLRAVIGSSLAMHVAGNEDLDVRLMLWTERRGEWVAAVADGQVAAVAVALVEGDEAELVWVEVADAFKGRGIGRELLDWSRSLAPRFRVRAEKNVVGFYERHLGVQADATGVFTV